METRLAEPLTRREQEVLQLLREGLTNHEIARRMEISPDGAKYHVSEIIGKLGVRNRYEASVWPQQPPWWLGISAPIALFLRKLGWAPTAALGTAVIAIAAGVGLLLWGLMRAGGDGGVRSVPEGLDFVAFEPGRTITASGPGIFFIDLETGAAEAWTVPEAGLFGFSVAAVSADGTLVLYTCRQQQQSVGPIPCGGIPEPGTWYLLNTESGERRELPVGMKYLSLSPDGRTLLAEKEGRLVFLSASDPQRVVELMLPSDAPPFAAGLAAWSPDSTAAVIAPDDGSMRLVRVVDGETTELVAAEEPRLGFRAEWSPDGSKLALVRGADLDRKDLRPSTAPGLLVFDEEGELLWTNVLRGAGAMEWSPDGTQLAVEVDPPRVPTPDYALDFRLDVFDGANGDALYRIDGILCSGDLWTADGAKLLVITYDGQGTYVADPATRTFQPLGVFAGPNPLDPSQGIHFDGSNSAQWTLPPAQLPCSREQRLTPPGIRTTGLGSSTTGSCLRPRTAGTAAAARERRPRSCPSSRSSSRRSSRAGRGRGRPYDASQD